MKVVQEEQNSAVAADNAEAAGAGGGVFAAAGDIQMKNCHLDHDRQKMMMMMKRPHL